MPPSTASGRFATVPRCSPRAGASTAPSAPQGLPCAWPRERSASPSPASGADSASAPVAAVAPTGAASQVLYRHGSISEFYRNGPYGLEQGFTVRQRPQAGTGSLVLALAARGIADPEAGGIADPVQNACRRDGAALRPAERAGCHRPSAARAHAAPQRDPSAADRRQQRALPAADRPVHPAGRKAHRQRRERSRRLRLRAWRCRPTATPR